MFLAVPTFALCVSFPGSSGSSRQFRLLPSASTFPTVSAFALCVNFPGSSGSSDFFPLRQLSRQFRQLSTVLGSSDCSRQFRLLPYASAFSIVPAIPGSSGCSRQFQLLTSASAFPAAALILPALSLPLCFCIHCPSAATPNHSLNFLSKPSPRKSKS